METTHHQQDKTVQYSIFNGEYEVMNKLGAGKTSRVYLCRLLNNPKKKFALKIFRHEYLQDKNLSIQQIQDEIKILYGLDHPNITKLHGFGSDGKILKPTGKLISNLVFLLIEYAPGDLLFDKCQDLNGFGEDVGCSLMEQLTEVLDYMYSK